MAGDLKIEVKEAFTTMPKALLICGTFIFVVSVWGYFNYATMQSTYAFYTGGAIGLAMIGFAIYLHGKEKSKEKDTKEEEQIGYA